MNTLQVNEFSNAFEMVQTEVFRIAVEHGGWEDRNPNDAEKMMLIVTEIAEATEALRNGKDTSEHIPQFTGVEEELADVVIRIMDYAAFRKLDVAGAILAKIRYNEKREYKHGGKSF